MSASQMDPQTFENAGQWAQAADAYRRLSQQALNQSDIGQWLRALNGTARMLHQDGHAEEAEELAHLSHRVAQLQDMGQQAVRAINILAIIRCSVDDLDVAEQLWQDALPIARRVGDHQSVGMICQNLGVIANIRGRLRDARLLYLECIAACVGSDNREAVRAAYNNLGMVCSDLGEWMEAEIYFTRGIELAEQDGDRALLAKLYVNRAEPLIHVGEFTRAAASLERAEALARVVDDTRVLSDVERYRGVAALVNGNHAQAENHLQRALSLAESAGLDLEHAEALEEMAHLRWAQGRQGAARVLLREACRAFDAVGASRDVKRVKETSAGWRETH